jgi:hypothetical protein
MDVGFAITKSTRGSNRGYIVRMSRGLGVVGCVTILAIAGAAHAQDAPEPLAVAYEAPEGCPAADAFFREITARTTRARAAQPNERARVMHVVVAKQGEEYAGRLWIQDANASSTARSVSGKTCREVVGALALIGALSVDPRASTAPIAASPLATSPSATEPATAAGSQPGAAASKDAPRAPDAPAQPTEPTAPAPIVTPPSAPASDRAASQPGRASRPGTRGRLEVGAQVEVATFAGAVPSGRLFGDLSIGPRDGLFAPAVRLAVTRSLDVDRAAAIGGATLRWTTGALDVCPIRIALAGPLALRPCAGGTFGVLDASGTGIAGSVSRTRPWATLSAQARLVWEPLTWLDVELEAGVIAPLYRESFLFTPSVAVYEAPAVAFLSRAGLGVRFP